MENSNLDKGNGNSSLLSRYRKSQHRRSPSERRPSQRSSTHHSTLKEGRLASLYRRKKSNACTLYCCHASSCFYGETQRPDWWKMNSSSVLVLGKTKSSLCLQDTWSHLLYKDFNPNSVGDPGKLRSSSYCSRRFLWPSLQDQA